MSPGRPGHTMASDDDAAETPDASPGDAPDKEVEPRSGHTMASDDDAAETPAASPGDTPDKEVEPRSGHTMASGDDAAETPAASPGDAPDKEVEPRSGHTMASDDDAAETPDDSAAEPPEMAAPRPGSIRGPPKPFSLKTFFRKWAMRQYWRLQQSQAIISMVFWSATLTLLIWPYVKWRFENETGPFDIPLTYVGLVSIFLGVVLTVLTIGFVYDRFLGLWKEWRTVDTERNPFATYQLIPFNAMMIGAMADLLERVAAEDEEVQSSVAWIRQWVHASAREEIFSYAVRGWDQYVGRMPELHWFEPGTVEEARSRTVEELG